MNANELADELLEDLKEIDLFNVDSDMYGNRQHYIEQLESVVRQQQAEIEALKKTIESLFGGLESSLALNKAQVERKQ